MTGTELHHTFLYVRKEPRQSEQQEPDHFGDKLGISSLKRISSLTDLLLSLWRLSWFGIIGGFLFVGIVEFRHEIPRGGAVAHFTIALLTVVTLSWITFFAAHSQVRTRDPLIVRLLTLTGTFLAVFTLLGIYFFVIIASRLP
jgi:hypothetical protein